MATKKQNATIIGQENVKGKITRVIDIFVNSRTQIRPHFILTGASGNGKSHLIECLCKLKNINYFKINAAQLTKEGTSGNSVSKALSPLRNMPKDKPIICFVDEFDKLFISGNTNDGNVHETTVGVQNEFLSILEDETTQIYGDYGKYETVGVNNVLFIFAGAFNNEENLSIERLQEIGVKTEFLGRVGLIFNTEKLSLNELLIILETSETLKLYQKLFTNRDGKSDLEKIKEIVSDKYDDNRLGARMIDTLIHQFFISDGKIDTFITKPTLDFKTF